MEPWGSDWLLLICWESSSALCFKDFTLSSIILMWSSICWLSGSRTLLYFCSLSLCTEPSASGKTLRLQMTMMLVPMLM